MTTEEKTIFISGLCQEMYTEIFLFANGYCKDKHLTEEVVQEVFYEAWCHAEKLKMHENQRGWIYNTAKYKIKQSLAKRARLQAHEVPMEEFAHELCVEDAYEFLTLDEFSHMVSKEQLELLKSHYQEGNSYVEMAGQKNDHLIQELRLEMEEELDKGPVEMDTEKIKQINLLLAKLEDRDTLPQDMELESFLQRFDKKYGINLLAPFKTSQPMNSPKRKSSWRVRAVIAMIAVVVLAGIGNAASVAAMDKSLWQIIKETTHGVYFRTLQSKGEVIEKGVGEHYEIYSDWEALEESMGIGILLPEYIPDGLELEMIEKNIFENSEEIMAYYYNGDIQLSISCEYYTIKGDFYKNKGGNKILGQQSQIGGRNVYISIEDDINIIFIEDDVIYTIDTNLDLEEAEKVVENLR